MKESIAMRKSVFLSTLVIIFSLTAGPLVGQTPETVELVQLIPRVPEGFKPQVTNQVADLAGKIELYWSTKIWEVDPDAPPETLDYVKNIIEDKRLIDERLDALFELRIKFASLPANSERLDSVREYLRVTSAIIDLAGRVRYAMRDLIFNATFVLTPRPDLIDELISAATENQVGIAAMVMTYVLFDPPADSGVGRFSDEAKVTVLNLIAASKPMETLPDLVRFLDEPSTTPALKVLTAKVIREIGLPQDPLSIESSYGNDQAPPIQASSLLERLDTIDVDKLSEEDRQQLVELRTWLDSRIQNGVVEESYRVGRFDVKEGDWLLIRNPSPYNSFTDIGTGLFTHVGVIAARTDSQGIRRFVVVEMPERLDAVPESNVETYLGRTLHYVFLRHEDPKAARKMGEVAGSLVGKPTQFDLTFRTDRVAAMKGRLDQIDLVNTYCAGFLLLCSQETGLPRQEFFPIQESSPGPRFEDNIEKLGLSIGKDFVSPTGPLFSLRMRVVGRCEPMYSPEREIKEAIYDHFAFQLINARLTPSPNGYQMLREKLAGLSQSNPILARAMARANNVSEHMDLQAAAKASAVIETLDDIADGNAARFVRARKAIQAGPMDRLREVSDAEQLQEITQYRRVHDDLFVQWVKEELSPRDLRSILVDYYITRGTKSLDDRFFQSGSEN